MDKRPVEFNLAEWLILTDLVKAIPRRYQDKDHKGSDLFNIEKLAIGCGGSFFDVGPTESKQRAALVTKLKRLTDEGYRHIEFRPFDGPDDVTG